MPTPIKYTPELIQDLQARYRITHTSVELAAEYGTKPEHLRASINRLRKKGYVFSSAIPEGTTRTNTNKFGETTEWTRQDGKWAYVKGSYKPGQIRPKKAGRIKDKARPKEAKGDIQESRKQPSLSGRNPTKHTRTRNPVVNTENPKDVRKKSEVGGQWVKIDHRTIVYRQNRVA